MSQPRLDPISEQAIDWMVRLRAGTPDAVLKERFEAWLALDHAHAQAWDRLQERLDGSFNTVRALDRRLPGQAGDARKVLLQPHTSRRDALRVIAGLGVLGGGLWLGGKTRFAETLMADLHTGRGQRQTFNLTDGSRLSLNAESAMDLRFDETRRLVILRHGELVIEVAHDPRRPLIVRTAEGEMRALGTRFLVAQDQDSSRLVVLQHSVEARLFNGTSQVVGEGQAVVLSARAITLASGDEGRRADWLNGRLNVLDESLEQVVAALRPYSRGFVRVAPEIRNLRVQGVFPLDDPERTLSALAETLPIRVNRYSPWLTLISKK